MTPEQIAALYDSGVFNGIDNGYNTVNGPTSPNQQQYTPGMFGGQGTYLPSSGVNYVPNPGGSVGKSGNTNPGTRMPYTPAPAPTGTASNAPYGGFENMNGYAWNATNGGVPTNSVPHDSGTPYTGGATTALPDGGTYGGGNWVGAGNYAAAGPGRYTGTELVNWMQKLPEGARYGFSSQFSAGGQGNTDFGVRLDDYLGGRSSAAQWINYWEGKSHGTGFDPATGDYNYYDPQTGELKYGHLDGWNGAAYGGTASTPATGSAATPATGGAATAPAGTSASSSGGWVPHNAQQLENSSRQILGAYFKTKADGTPDWAAMGDPAFFNTLPQSVREAMVQNHLGAMIRSAAGMPLLEGQSLPPGFTLTGASTTSPTNPTGTTSTSNNPSAPAAGSPAASEYFAPTQAVDPGNPMDFFNEAGYKYALDQTSKAIENSRAARGTLNSGNALKELQANAEGLAAQNYQQAFDRWANQRNYNRSAFESDRNFGWNQYTNQRDFDEAARKWGLTFDRDTTQSDRDFNESQRRNNRDFDYTAAVGDRNFGENQRQFDLGFNRDTAQSDRTFNWGTLKDLANLGLSGTGGNANLQAALAAILSNNTIAGGNAAAGGTVGSSNAVNNFVTMLLQQMFGNKLVTAAGGG